MHKQNENFVRKVVLSCVGEKPEGIKYLASVLGVSERTVYRWMNGKCDVSASAFIAICDLMGIDFSIRGKYLRKANLSTCDESEDSSIFYSFFELLTHMSKIRQNQFTINFPQCYDTHKATCLNEGSLEMTDYNNYKNWKNSHSIEMANLAFSEKDSIFIYTCFRDLSFCGFEEQVVLYAESIEEAAGYFRHIFLHDLLLDICDDLELDTNLRTEERQGDAIILLDFRVKIGKAFKLNTLEKVLPELCIEFNNRFNNRGGLEYEFRILDGADELRQFLEKKFAKDCDFNKKLFEKMCSDEAFDGKLLFEVLKELFRQN